MKSLQLGAALAMMLGTAALLQVRGQADHVPPSLPLQELPVSIASWAGQDLPLSAEVLAVLGKGSFLNRSYNQPQGSHPVGLFIGYFPTQRTGQAIHSPQNCLPGAGWNFEKKGVTALMPAQGAPIEVGEYLISDGKSRAEVLYWYRAHGRSMASDYAAKLHTLTDSIRYGRTDAALIRIITPVASGEDTLAAHNRAVSFAHDLLPELPPYLPE